LASKYYSDNQIKLAMQFHGHAACTGDRRNAYSVLVVRNMKEMRTWNTKT